MALPRFSFGRTRLKLSGDAWLLVISGGFLFVLLVVSGWLIFAMARDVRTLFSVETPPMVPPGFDLEAGKRLERLLPQLFTPGPSQ